MTLFIVLSAVMLAAVVLWIVLPLLRTNDGLDAAATRRERTVSTVVTTLAVSALAVSLYAHLSNWDWNAKAPQAGAQTEEVENLLAQLEAKLKANPQDVTGWLLLGRSYTSIGRYESSVGAYQHAYDLTNGENPDAVIGLGESLAMMDESSLQGRAGELFDKALKLAPNHPKALWYGSMAALQAGDLRKGRDRLKLLLAQNPPEELRGVLERQIQDLDQQIGESEQGAPASAAANASNGAKAPPTSPTAASPRSIRVAVSLAPQLQARLGSAVSLFILARDPKAPGPPLAVQRRMSSELPITIDLSESDAMMPSRTIANVPSVQVVARLSASGTPQAQSGDFFGQADYDFANVPGTLQIVIDQVVP